MTPINHTKPIRTLLLAAALLTLTACSSGFPRGNSQDWDITTSQGHNQWRVAIQDTITGQELWAIDVPDGQSLVIDLKSDNYGMPTQTGSIPAESLKWGLFDIKSSIGSLPNEMQLPGNPILLRKTLRTPDSPPATYEQPMTAAPAAPAVPASSASTPASAASAQRTSAVPARSSASAPASSSALSADDAP